ncbi:hypothetical protein BDL97_12G059200 [Sphagnum fallax]|nr:hypothetical protein BDL97_12G059200 [Sphagnum fallax]
MMSFSSVLCKRCKGSKVMVTTTTMLLPMRRARRSIILSLLLVGVLFSKAFLLPALASRPLRDDDLEKASMDTSGRRLGTTTLEVSGFDVAKKVHVVSGSQKWFNDGGNNCGGYNNNCGGYHNGGGWNNNGGGYHNRGGGGGGGGGGIRQYFFAYWAFILSRKMSWNFEMWNLDP